MDTKRNKMNANNFPQIAKEYFANLSFFERVFPSEKTIDKLVSIFEEMTWELQSELNAISILQKEENENGIPQVEDVVFWLRKNDFCTAKKLFDRDMIEIQKYPLTATRLNNLMKRLETK